jgi:cell division protein FtsW
VLGLIMVYSASFVFAHERLGDGYYFLRRQGLYALLGIALMAAAAKFPYQYLKPLAWPIAVLSYFTLLVVLVPGVGIRSGGAQRWLPLGFAQVEPSEFAKLAVVVFLAYRLWKLGDEVSDFRKGFLPNLLTVAAFAGVIIKQPDLGTCVTIGLIALVMLFLSGTNLKYLAGTALAAAPVLAFAIMSADYRVRRLWSFWEPWSDPLGCGFQIIHSLLAIGSGGVTGQGLGGGYQKLFYLPQSHTDFIFSVLAEEMGLVGVCLVVGLFTAFVVRGLWLSSRVGDPFGQLLAQGLTVLVGLQAGINIAVVMALVPTKGLTLPFMSYGGSSLIMNMTAVGVLLNVASQWREA